MTYFVFGLSLRNLSTHFCLRWDFMFEKVRRLSCLIADSAKLALFCDSLKLVYISISQHILGKFRFKFRAKITPKINNNPPSVCKN